MITKPLVAGLLAAGCLGAAAGGAYVALRQNAADLAVAAAVSTARPAPAAPVVAESEAVVAPQPEATPLVAPAAEPAVPKRAPGPELERAAAAPAPARTRRSDAPAPRPASGHEPRRGDDPAPVSRPAPNGTGRPAPEWAGPQPDPAASPSTGDEAVIPAAIPPAEPARADLPPVSEPLPALAEREFVQVVLPASSVIGLQVETAVSTERARVEDRVDARVTRDVLVDGRVAIPAGSRVIGSVTLVERGGKIKERARLGVRFHTLVFADGSEVPIRTEAIYREGDSPSSESAKKIGGAAVGGAILGAIIGGGKGAMIGGAAGAAGGTAATMAGDRNPATLPAGAVVTVRLSEPLTLDLEK